MKSIKNLLALIIITSILASCNNKPSLQKYYVDNQETQNFMVADIPTSILNIDQEELSESQLQAYKSIIKLNFLGFKINNDNSSIYEVERKKIKKILSNDSYKSLIKYGGNKQGAIVKYLGSETKIDEVIIFGSDDTKGFGIIRVLGDDMNPSKMLELFDVIKKSKLDTLSIKKIANFF
jgi:hypothetical protein